MKTGFKGMIKRGIAVGLMALMACVNPLQTLSPANGGSVAKAAGTAAPYVGDLMSHKAAQKGIVWDPLRVRISHTRQASLLVRDRETGSGSVPPQLAQQPPGKQRKASVSQSSR